MTAAAILAAARELVAGRERCGGWWPRAAALLGRRALELDVAIRISRRHGDPDNAPFSGQLLVLPGLVSPEVARRAAWAWGGLSSVIHQNGYEIAPTADELEGWFAAIDALIETPNREAQR